MTTLEQAKLLIGLSDSSKDSILTLLIDMSCAEAISYCHLAEYTAALDSVVVQMAIEKYNRLGTEGVSSQSFSGVSESFVDGYSAGIIYQMNKHRKLVLL